MFIWYKKKIPKDVGSHLLFKLEKKKSKKVSAEFGES